MSEKMHDASREPRSMSTDPGRAAAAGAAAGADAERNPAAAGMDWLRGRTVLVLGLGESGLAMARWCDRLGARLRVWDSREAPPLAGRLAETVPAAQWWRGALGDDEALGDVALVLKSPGLSPLDPAIAPLLARAASIGLAIQGEVDLFGRALADLREAFGYAPRVLAVTGTNGKTTTTAMTAALVERTGRRVAVAGNIGPTMLQTLADALDRERAAGGLQDDRSASEWALRQAQGERGAVASALRQAQGERGASEPALRQAQGERAGAEGDHVGLSSTSVPAESIEPSPIPARAESLQPSSTPVRAEPVEAPGTTVSIEPDDATPSDDDLADLRALDGIAANDGVDEAPDTPPVDAPEPPAAEPVFAHLPEVWVLELSSFQLDGARGFEPDAAALLNLTQDHLDWHGTMAHYAAAKRRILGERAVAVVNRDDAGIEALVAPPPAPEPVRGRKAKAPAAPARRIVRFGTGAPRRAGDFGIVDENGMAWLVRAREVDETLRRGRQRADAARVDDPQELAIQRLMPADALRVRGRHNAANALAALALATAIGCPLAPMLHALREYAGEPHRVEFVATIDRVDAFDDSKGTNVGATVAALQGLGADRAPAKLVVILGGDGKGQDFAPLAEPVRRHVRAVATLGRDAGAIEAALAAVARRVERVAVADALPVSGDPPADADADADADAAHAPADIPLERHPTLEAATRWAYAQARPGDAVLLSPACASLDMFRNYAHRAEVFVAEVHALAADRGEIV